MKGGQLQQMLATYAHNTNVSLEDGGRHVDVLDAFLTLQWDTLTAHVEPGRGVQRRAAASLLSNAVFNYHAAAQNVLARQSFALPLIRRAVLECCLYAARVADSRDAATAWWLRHREYLEHHHEAIMSGREPDARRIMSADKASRKAAREQFSIKRCKQSVANVMSADADAGQIAEALAYVYEAQIDQGAHPNVLLVLMNSETIPGSGAGAPDVTIDQMTNNDPARYRLDMRSLYSLGVLVVRILCALLPDAAAKTSARDRLAEIGDVVKGLPR